MKNIVLLVIFILGIVLLQYVQSHSVDEIIRKYLDARGGQHKLKAIRSIYMEGSRSIMGTQIPVRVTIVHNQLYRTDFKFKDTPGYAIVTPVGGWSMIPARSSDPAPIPPEQVSAMQFYLDIGGPMVDYKAKGHKAQLQGKEFIDGKEAHVIRMTLHNDQDILYYIDKETSLLLQSKQTKPGDTTWEIVTNYSDYKLFEGVLFPQTISNPGDDIMSGITTYETIVINNKVDDSEYIASS